MEDFDDPVLSCLAELETCLHGIYASLDNISYGSAANQDCIDGIIIRYERLLVAVVLLSGVDNLSDAVLSGIDAVYDSIEEIVAFWMMQLLIPQYM